ncbi:MAG: ABC transporter substrate-binding protein [Actinobacteria bacterium]|nr:ABC transporter substrate-binding protein [Actinomycetota bacterium]
MTTGGDNSSGNGINAEITRRRLLQVGGTGALAIGLGGVLAACGGGGNSAGPSTGAGGGGTEGTPQRGGTLRVGATGGGTSDTLDAQNSLLTTDFIRAGALSEQLMILNAKTGAPEPVLAESVEPNKDATEWTIRVRKGVTFHDGKPLTAKDVLYSLQRIEKEAFPGLVSLGPINLKAAKAMDSQTLRIPFDSPYSILPEGLAGGFTIRIVPVGYDPKNPIGTGPFKYKSFTPGQQSTFERYDGYWQHGKPYLDSLVIIDFADETAQVNALQAGQVDLVNQLSYPSVAPIEGNGGKVVVSKTAAFVNLAMRVDTAPFDDVRVRQALRYAVNREQLNQQVWGGYGSPGNDVFGSITPAFKSLPQREQDLEQAKSLLQQAGQSGLNVTLYSSAVAPGAESTASVFASQAKEAGVTVNIKTQPPTQFFAQSYGKVPFAISFWTVASYLVESGQGVAKGAPFNEIHQEDPHWQSLYEEAIGTTDEKKREEISEELMKFDYEQGGYIIPAEWPTIEGTSSKVFGVSENISGYPLNGSSGIQDVWMQG